jgi:N,N'-diacetyllegionaminate synthase
MNHPNNRLDLAGRSIGEGMPTFVIAEIGVNHDGSVDRAIELVRSARDAGADAIKLQLFAANRLVHHSAQAASYQKVNCGATDQESLLRKYELSVDDVERIIDAARVMRMIPIATPFSPQDVFVIEHLKLPAVKIASPDLVNKPLLRRVSLSGKPMLISTGAATVAEIDQCVAWLRGWGVAFALMHCVSAYPTPPEQARLAWIEDLRLRYAVPVGYSDHTTELWSGALATSAGACVIEKHLTWNRFADGPDHAASADPDQFRIYVESLRRAEIMRGRGSREVLPIEQDVRRLSRQSLVLGRSVRAGETIAADSLIVQRPGTGILASEIDVVTGRVAARDLEVGTILAWDMLDHAA